VALGAEAPTVIGICRIAALRAHDLFVDMCNLEGVSRLGRLQHERLAAPFAATARAFVGDASALFARDLVGPLFGALFAHPLLFELFSVVAHLSPS
jgi:hypothetical protein